MTDDERLNSTPVHVKGEDGNWVPIGEILNQAPEYWARGHGLYGTPSDYIRFTRALLRGGELDGARILRPETVADAFRNQIGELDFPAEIPTFDPASTNTLALGPGYKWSGAWAGLCNTHFWVDRTTGVCASIYSNSLPFVTPEALALYQDFERALYAAL
jgi:CubicO group peptidase (beta-lactamase class C family)